MTDGGARTEKRLYGTLDGMRGVAAIAVVILHAPALFGAFGAPSGGLAVDLFFVMSGFIIAHAYEQKLVSGPLSPARFILLRLIRLYPLYLVGLALGVAEAMAEFSFGRTQAWTLPQMALSGVAGLFMLPAPPGIADGAAPAFRLNPPAWSLFFEMVVNVLYALVATRLSTRVLSVIIGVGALALVGSALYAGDLKVGAYWSDLWGGFPRVIFSFSVGLLVYRLRDRICVFKVHPLPILVAGAVIFAIDPGGVWTGVYEVVCTLFILPFLVVLGASVEPKGALLPVCKFLGVTSYAIYSMHYPIIMGIQGVARKLPWLADGAGTPWIGLAVVGALLGGCYLVVKLYDEPVRARLMAMLARRPARSLRLQEQTK